ncbi:MAG: adenosine kinase [Leptospiraceae bacterium]|nr:MAG: adenosine kinase [Leptospiraceae bacterium]
MNLDFNKLYDVYGIGNAIVDLLVFIDDILLQEISLPKGHMTLASSKEQAFLINLIENKHLKIQMTSGGSAANTMITVTKAGGKAFYTGKIASDPYGEFYRINLLEAGVDFDVHPLSEDHGSTATCVVLVTPDAERTMSTHLGVSILLTENDIQESIIQKSKIVYIEGYLWLNEQTRNAALKTIEIARKNQIPVSFTFSDGFVVEQFRNDFYNHLIKNDFSIVFMNLDEAKFFTQKENENDIINELKKFSNLLFVTASEKGCYVIQNKESILVSGYPVKPLDTTGAGDTFAGGVIFGLSHGYDVIKSAKIGNFLASEVVQIQGARLQKDYSDKIQNIIQ